MPPAAAARQLLHHLGRRGGVLVSVGIGWCGYGSSIILNPRYGTTRGIAALIHYAPSYVWGYGWITAGALALLCGLVRGPRVDGAGFLCAAVPPTVWSVAYLIAWATGSYPPVWGGAIAWATNVSVILICSGWLELPRATIRAMRGQGDGSGS